MKKLFTLLFAMVTSINFIHADFVQSVIGPTQTITYHFYTESRTAEVVGFAMVTGSVVIPEQVLWADIYYTVTGIGEGAFRNCTNLTSITMPDLLDRIGDNAFHSCSNLTNITFPFNRLQSIGNYAFYGCTGLISIAIPNSVTRIGEWAFAECSSLASMRIGNSVITIGDYAFAYSRLTSVTIPNSVTTIGEHAFLFCFVTSINFIGSMKDWCYKLWNPSQLFTDVDGYRLYINGVLQENIDIPNNVTSIGDNAFEYCIGLTSVTIPNSVTSIGSAAFRNCSSLTSITIPNSVTSIGSGAFLDCSSLTSISIPNSVTSIGEHAFDYCSGLTSIVVENGNTTYDSRNNCNAIIETFTNTLIAGCMNTIIPNSVTSIGNSAFVWCSSLTSISIPNSVTSIGDWAFAGCNSLTSVTIPNSVENIGDNPFYYCSGLDSLVFESENPATLGVGGFDYTNNCPLIVPCSAVDAYKTAWPTYADRITCLGTPGDPQETDHSIPTVQDLATAGYDVINKVVLCIRFTDDATVCNDIYAVGTFNNWAKGEGNAEDFANCSKFEPLAGFEGWYAVEFPYSDNVQGKPVQAKSNGAFSWEYQSGDANAWTNKGGAGSQTATIWAGYNNEANIYYYSPGCYIYELAYWKNHNSPCANTTHNYTLHMYAPDACEEMKPAIIGNFNNWNTGVAMKDTADAQGKKMYTITIASDEGLVFKFRDASYDNWNNELQEYLSDVKVWATFSNFMIPAATQDTTIVYDFSDNDKYRFAQCEKEENVIVWLRVPTGAPGYYNGAIEMVVYSADEPTAMPLQYNQEDNLWSIELQAKGSDYFSVREANSGDNYILDYVHYYYSDGSDEYLWETWGTTFQNYWENGAGDFVGYKTAMIDLTNPASFKWAVPAIETDIENVQRDDVPCTMVSKFLWDGQIYILNNGIMYNVQGQKMK